MSDYAYIRDEDIRLLLSRLDDLVVLHHFTDLVFKLSSQC